MIRRVQERTFGRSHIHTLHYNGIETERYSKTNTSRIAAYRWIPTLSILSILLLSSFSFLVNIDAGNGVFGDDPMDVVYGDETVTIDGDVGTNEWSDGDAKKIDVGGKDWNIGYKQDSNYIYIMSNYVMEHIFEICIDTNYDGGFAPQPDDMKLHMSLGSNEKVGNGSYWTSTPVSGWTSTMGFQYTHEIRIEFSKLRITPGSARALGFCIWIYWSSGSAIYPDTADKDVPYTWTLMSSTDNWTEPISEPPELDLGGFFPSKGTTSDDFSFTVTYSDPEGDVPTRSDIVIDGYTYRMISDDDTYGSGAVYTYTTDLPWGQHEYHFVFSDGTTEIRSPSTGEVEGPTVYLPNTAPLLDKSIPSDTISIREDIDEGENLLDLEEYFSDDRDDGNLNFQITYQENTSLARVYLNGSMICIEQEMENWFGILEVSVKAVDNGIEELPFPGHVKETQSNIFTIEIEPQNDPASIKRINGMDVSGSDEVSLMGSKGAKEDQLFIFQIRAGDIDLDLDETEALKFLVDDDRFDISKIDEVNAEISFTPDNDDVGTVTVNVTVEDAHGSSDARLILIEVMNTNDIPYIDHVIVEDEVITPLDNSIDLTGSRAYNEDDWFNTSIVVIDDDLDVDPAEGFSFHVEETISGLHLDMVTGELSLLLTQDHVGEIEFTVRIKDREGWEYDDHVTFRIEVKNVNDPPYNSLIISEKPDLVYENGSFVNLSAIADDIDLLFDPGEVLHYKWTSDLDGILGTGPMLSTRNLSVGNHTITVMVTDSKGLSTSNSVKIQVKEVETHYTVGDEDEGVRESLYLGYMILIMVIFFLTVTSGGIFVYGRIKRKKLLDNLRRKKIFELVNNKPGVYFMDISKELGLSQGVLSHHLNMLEKFEFVRSMQDGKYRRFYPFDHKVEFNLNLTNIQQMILYIVKEEPGISQTKISESVGKNKVVVNYHVKILRDIGFLDIERDGRLTHCFITGTAADFINE